jgi:carbonic anhydrase/acetyltransferase-like protein (isoleucine patch superfamily)
MIQTYKNAQPQIEKAAFVAESADIIGEVYAGEGASLWYNVSIRADIAPIYIGEGTSIQDGSVIHVGDDLPCRVGKYATVGHGVILHACTVQDCCLIGMGAIILDGSEISEGSIVGAGALVTQNKKFPPRSMILGSPAKVVRTLSEEEVEEIRHHAERYIELAESYGS